MGILRKAALAVVRFLVATVRVNLQYLFTPETR